MSEVIVTREHREAVQAIINRYSVTKTLAETMAEFLATREHAALQAGRESAQGEWVAVEERLPDEGKLVLFWHSEWPSNADPGYGLFRRDDEGGDWWEDMSDTDQSGEGAIYYSGVTHWATLPPPPSDPSKGGAK